MKNLQAPESHARIAAHSRYRQDYMAINLHPNHAPGRSFLSNVVPTQEFPLLADPVCKRLITVATLESLEEMRVALDVSNVELQGLVERFARNAGFSGWTVPSGFIARLKLRLRCCVRIMRVVANETLP